jgi:hypothetical protein
MGCTHQSFDIEMTAVNIHNSFAIKRRTARKYEQPLKRVQMKLFNYHRPPCANSTVTSELGENLWLNYKVLFICKVLFTARMRTGAGAGTV